MNQSHACTLSFKRVLNRYGKVLSVAGLIEGLRVGPGLGIKVGLSLGFAVGAEKLGARVGME